MSDAPVCRVPIDDESLRFLHYSVMAGLPNGKRLLEFRRIEAMISEVEEAIARLFSISAPDRINAALGAIATAAWDELPNDPSPPQNRLVELWRAWSSGEMSEAQRRPYERFLTASGLQVRLRSRVQDTTIEGVAPPDLSVPFDLLMDILGRAAETDDPRHLDATLDSILIAQRRCLAIPEGPESAARWQALNSAYRGEMPAPERELYERNMTAASLRMRLRAARPECATPEPPLTEDEIRLQSLIDKRLPAVRAAQAHTVPGSINAEGLEQLSALIAEWEATLAATPESNRRRSLLCFYIGSASWALGRGYEQSLLPEAAKKAYSQAAACYAEGGEPENAAVAREKAAALDLALRADVDGGVFEDLRRLAQGIVDPLERAMTFGRLCAQAAQANDNFQAGQYAEAAAVALEEAGFSDPGSHPVEESMADWIRAAAKRRAGNDVLKLIQRVGDLAQRILLVRHTKSVTTDPARAQFFEESLSRLQSALLFTLSQSDAVEAEIVEGLKPYIELDPTPGSVDSTSVQELQALMRDTVALSDVATAPDDPSASAQAQAEALIARAKHLGQPGPLAQTWRVMSLLKQRAGDNDGAEAAAASGEAALLPNGAEPRQLVDPTLFDLFLMCRRCRCDAAAASKAPERLLYLAEGAVRAIEANRYGISDPFQQGRFLSDRALFYNMAAFCAFKLERWDTLIEVMDLIKSRAALRGKLAPPPDQDATELAAEVTKATREIETAPAGQQESLREKRRRIWSLLAIARMRPAAGESLPTLTLAAIQSALATDEALVSWLLVAEDVLLVLAIDRSRVMAERVILDEAQKEALRLHIQTLHDPSPTITLMAANVQPVAEAMLPASVRAFTADAKRLIFSPHKSLHLVPLHAARFDGRYLIRRSSVRYIPNLGSLLIPWRGNENGDVISIGINTFGRGIEPLKNAEAEAAEVAKIWGENGASARTLIGAEATRAAFVNLDLTACRGLFLATHAQSVYSDALKQDPFASRICLADADLEALSLAELPLRADLVVMSACHSGQRALSLPGGADLPGDDLFGLQATLFQAGVRSVIAALWAVNDDSAPKIVPELHRRLARGDRPEQALQGALCTYLDTPGNDKGLFYWAPFFMSSIGRMSRQGEN